MFDEEEFIAELHAQGGPSLVAAVEREFRTGWDLQRHITEQRERQRSHVPHARSSALGDMGHISSSISAQSYFYWLERGRKKMGVQNIWAEDEFRRDYLRDNPQDVVKYQNANPFSGWTPERDRTAGVIVPAGKYEKLRAAA